MEDLITHISATEIRKDLTRVLFQIKATGKPVAVTQYNQVVAYVVGPGIEGVKALAAEVENRQ